MKSVFSWCLACVALVALLSACSDASTDSPADGDLDGDASDGDIADLDGDSDAELDGSDGDSDAEPDGPVYPDEWTFPRLHTEGLRIVDAHGRTAMLRGINVGGRSKLPPFIPWEGTLDDPEFDAKLGRFMDFTEDWGMNCARLTVFWEALEPVRGQVDADYLDLVERQILALKARGVYVFIDFHQDLFSRWLGGSGAPSWALENPPAEPPELNDTGWFMKVFSDDAVMTAFDRFWEDEDGIRSAYADTVVAVATRFADTENVLGIDLMNEPNPGATGSDDQNAWYNERLIPFYKDLAQRIRQVAPEFMVFVEPSGMEAGVSGGDAGWTIEGLENYVFAPHYYFPMQFVTGEYSGGLDSLREALAEKAARAEALGAPVLLSEFGFRGTEGDTGKDENAGWFLTDIYTALDELQMHATVWTHEASEHYWNREDCSFVNGDWSERVPRGDAVARPYAPLTAGVPIEAVYSADTRRFAYSYTYDAQVDAPTLIRLPKRHYPQAPQVSLSFGRATYIASLGLLVVDETVGERAPEDGAVQEMIVTP